MSFVCNHCDRSFLKESSLIAHSCEQKLRHLERNETGVQLGYQAYLKFYEITQGSARLKKWEDFVRSAYYKAFVKFGRHCQAIRAINIPRFITWVIEKNQKLDHWCKESVYSDYLLQLLHTEPMQDAMVRALEQAIAWQEETGNPAHDYLRYGNPNVVCFAITTGRISPWVLYNTASGEEFLNKLSADLISMIWPMINTDIWQKRFQDYHADAMYVREILTQDGW
jgi:hypothetical protein